MAVWKPITQRFSNYYPYVRKWGLRHGVAAVRKLFPEAGSSDKTPVTTTLSLPHIRHPINLRPRTADIATFLAVFFEEEYRLELRFEPKFIVDGGANIGCVAVFFANCYPKAQIVAVEPENSNYALLEENCKDYANIKTIKSAIWSDDSYVKISNATAGKSSFQVEPAQAQMDAAFKGLSIATLMQKFNLPTIDILKLDVEGAEKEIFSYNYESWLDRVKVIVLELHDRFQPGCSEVVRSVLKNYDFEMLTKGDNTIFVKP